jgi:hypothetical protein
MFCSSPEKNNIHLYLYSIYIHTCAYIYIHAHTNNALILHDFSKGCLKTKIFLKEQQIWHECSLYGSQPSLLCQSEIQDGVAQ